MRRQITIWLRWISGAVERAHAVQVGGIQDPVESLKRIYEASGTEDPERLFKKQRGPSPAEELQMQALQAKTGRDMAGAQKDAAIADKMTAETQLLPRQADADVTKTLSDAQKAMMDTQLMPADRLMEAQRQDMEDAHRDKDREEMRVKMADKEASTV